MTNTLYLPLAALKLAMDTRMLGDNGKPDGVDGEDVESMRVTYLRLRRPELEDRYVHSLYGCNGNSAVRIQWVLTDNLVKTHDFGNVWGMTFAHYIKSFPKGEKYVELFTEEDSKHSVTLQSGMFVKQEIICDTIAHDEEAQRRLPMVDFYAGLTDPASNAYAFGRPVQETVPGTFYQTPSSQLAMWNVMSYFKPYVSKYHAVPHGKVEWCGQDGPIRITFPVWKELRNIQRLQVTYIYMPSLYRDDAGNNVEPDGTKSMYNFMN